MIWWITVSVVCCIDAWTSGELIRMAVTVLLLLFRAVSASFFSVLPSIQVRFIYLFCYLTGLNRIQLNNGSIKTVFWKCNWHITCMQYVTASESEISKVLLNCPTPNKQSDSDPIPTWLLKICASILLLPLPTLSICLSLQYFDTGGWVFWRVKTVSHITYTVLEGTLKHCSINQSLPSYSQRICKTYSRQRPALKLLSSLQPLFHIQNNRTCCKMSDLLITLFSMVFSVPTNLPTASITPLKQPWLYIHDHFINAIASQKLLSFSLMNILPSPIRSHNFLSPAILISVNSVVSVLTLILKQPVPLLPLLSTLNLTTVTLSTAVFIGLK